MVYVAQIHVNLSSQFLDKIEPRWSFEIWYNFVNKITGTKLYSLVVPLWNKWTGSSRQRTVHYYTLFQLIWTPPCSSRILFHPFWRLPVPVPPVSRTCPNLFHLIVPPVIFPTSFSEILFGFLDVILHWWFRKNIQVDWNVFFKVLSCWSGSTTWKGKFPPKGHRQPQFEKTEGEEFMNPLHSPEERTQ